jgi:flagellar basal body-associated protein FliL
MEGQAPVIQEPVVKKSSKTWLIILIVVVVLCCCCAAAAGGLYSFGDQIFPNFNPEDLKQFNFQ